MHREMRRSDRQLPQEEALSLLSQADHGILSVVGDEGWPYAVPLNYILFQGNLYLHCAKEGYKLDAIQRDPRVCFTVVTRSDLLADRITTAYESVIVRGTAALIDPHTEQWQAALEHLMDDLCTVSTETRERYLHAMGPKTAVICITPVQITGKANRKISQIEDRLKK